MGLIIDHLFPMMILNTLIDYSHQMKELIFILMEQDSYQIMFQQLKLS